MVCGAARAGGTNQLCPPGLGVSVPPACPERGKRDRHLSLIILTPDRCFMFDNVAIIKFMWLPLTKPVCSGLLGWISPASALARPDVQSHFSSRSQSPQWSDMSIPPLHEAFSFFYFPLPSADREMDSAGQGDVDGEALPFKGAIQVGRK